MSVYLVCGSRDWTDLDTMRRWFDAWFASHPGDVTVVHGGCRGADVMAGQLAQTMGIEYRVYPADWSRGPKAGPERNHRMLESERPRRALAFVKVDPNGHLSRGTNDMVRQALKAGVPVTIVTPGAKP